MANSYNANLDVLRFVCASDKAVNPSRDAKAVSPHDTNDLPIYGKIYVVNSHATAVQAIRVVPVEYTDDTTYVDLKVPPLTGIMFELIVRAVRATGTGADITSVIMA